MNYKAKLDFILEKMKVPGRDTMSLPEKSDAAKKATGKVTIDDALAYAKGGGKPVSSTSATVTAETPKKVEIIPPGVPTSVAHQVEVAAPQFNVNIPAPVVTVSHGDLTWSHVIRQGVLWLNGFVMGGTIVALFMVIIAMRAAP